MPKTETVMKQDLKIVRDFNTSRDELWKYFTIGDRAKQWFGSKDFTIPYYMIDLRVGGKSIYCMRLSDGYDVWGVGTFKIIEEPVKIVITDSFGDEKGNPVPGSVYGMDEDWPMELLITYTFEDLGNGKSRMTLLHEGLPVSHDAELTKVGWNESFDKLEKILLDS